MRPLMLDVLLENLGKNERNMKRFLARKKAGKTTPMTPKEVALRKSRKKGNAIIQQVGRRGIPAHQSAATGPRNMDHYEIGQFDKQRGLKRREKLFLAGARASNGGSTTPRQKTKRIAGEIQTAIPGTSREDALRLGSRRANDPEAFTGGRRRR